MKLLIYLTLAAGLLAFSVGAFEPAFFQSMNFGGLGAHETHTLLRIRSDGSCVLTNESVQDRKTFERQVTSWERYSKMSEGSDPLDEDTPAAPAAAPKALTDEELVAKVHQMYEQRPDFGQDEEGKVDAVQVSTNSVRLVTTRSFGSVKELLGNHPYAWGPSTLMFEDARFEIDTNRNLRIALASSPGATRYAKNMSRQWKSEKLKYEWKLMLPGKILGSGLPSTQDNATWITLDGEKPETIDAALKLIGSPLVITAEAGGLKLDEPLESKKLVQAAGRQRRGEPDVPITEASPGFQAEPMSISLSTVHYFPEAEKYLKGRREVFMYGQGATGAVVSAKLFPPKGREIKSVSGLRVKSAKDDQGRTISGMAEGADSEQSFSESVYFSSNESEKGGAARIELRLGLPAPDAKSIDELEAEAVALTIGGLKELLLTNIQADAKKEIDLAEVLPGAKLIINKVGGPASQRRVEATLEGPKAISQVELKLKSSGHRGSQSNMSERRSTTTGDKTRRSLTVQSFDFEARAEAKSAPVTLVVRYPQDVKRERVQFKLTALDLL